MTADLQLPGPPSHAGYDRVPPHNLEAEISVLGSMLLSKNAIAEIGASTASPIAAAARPLTR